MTRILIERFQPITCEKGLKFTIENKGVVIIKDHTTDKVIAMVNLNSDPNKNMDLAESVIDAIEDWIVSNEH